MTRQTFNGTMSMNMGGINRLPRSRQQGFSLLEVLVAMLILGIAVMGFAGLQVRALQSTGVAHVRSQAMTLVTDTSERIRANRSVDASAVYLAPANWTDDLPAGEPSSWGADTCLLTSTASNGCTDVQMALFDIREVRYTARQILPNGTVSVRACDGMVMVSCVFVAWNTANATTCNGNADVTGSCVMMKVIPW